MRRTEVHPMPTTMRIRQVQNQLPRNIGRESLARDPNYPKLRQTTVTKQFHGSIETQQVDIRTRVEYRIELLGC
jgi:hypothetical protein